jgi:hypothetical protein
VPLAADAFQPFVVRGLSPVKRPRLVASLSDVVISTNVGYDLSVIDSSQSIVLDFREPTFIAEALAADCTRFSCAAFQTASEINDDLGTRDRLAWGLLKLYYAAFYAGHATLRALGEGCTYFNKPHITRLVKMAEALSLAPGFGIESGLYHCILTQNDTAISCVRSRGKTGGAHEAFWNIFGTKLKAIGDGVLGGPLPRADAQAVFSQIDQLLRVLSKSAGYGWLSFVRNDIQYRLQHGVWYPEIMRSQSRDRLRGLAKQWTRDPMAIDLQSPRSDTLGDFTVSCAFVLSLCRDILRRIAERSTVGAQSFVKVGPISFLNDIGIAS